MSSNKIQQVVSHLYYEGIRLRIITASDSSKHFIKDLLVAYQVAERNPETMRIILVTQGYSDAYCDFALNNQHLYRELTDEELQTIATIAHTLFEYISEQPETTTTTATIVTPETTTASTSIDQAIHLQTSLLEIARKHFQEATRYGLDQNIAQQFVTTAFQHFGIDGNKELSGFLAAQDRIFVGAYDILNHDIFRDLTHVTTHIDDAKLSETMTKLQQNITSGRVRLDQHPTPAINRLAQDEIVTIMNQIANQVDPPFLLLMLSTYCQTDNRDAFTIKQREAITDEERQNNPNISIIEDFFYNKLEEIQTYYPDTNIKEVGTSLVDDIANKRISIHPSRNSNTSHGR